MTWNAPRTWVSSEVPTATIMNQHIRDNMIEQDSNVSNLHEGDLVHADAANSMGTKVDIQNGRPAPDLAHVVSDGTSPVWRGPYSTPSYAVGSAKYSAPAVGGYSDLDTLDTLNGVDVSVTIATGTQALVHYGARYAGHEGIGQNCQLSYRVSGATTIAASATWGTVHESDPVGKIAPVYRVNYQTGLNFGLNTFTLQIQSSGGTGGALLSYPWILVKPL